MSGSGYEDWDGDDADAWRRRVGLGVAALLGVVVIGWLVVVPALSDSGSEAVTIPTDALPATTAPVGDSSDPTATRAGALVVPTTRPLPTTTDEAASPRSTTPATDPVTEPATSDAVVAAGAPAPATSAPPAVEGVTYPTLPDGSPVPVIAIFDVDTITLSGTVPSQAAAERLKTLAIANSKTPAAVVDFLAIDPNVPPDVPVRVLELTSARFPEGSADIAGDHALELDRVVTVMNALPNVTVLVVGHADQRGDEMSNFQLSEQRAQAVVAYLAAHGIDPARLSSRAVGESDLITLGDDDAALALNRRTEFVFSGLLAGS